MSEFIRTVIKNSDGFNKRKSVLNSPFSNVNRVNSFGKSFYGINLDKCFVDLKSLDNIKSSLNYIKLRKLSAKDYIKKYFSICVIVEYNEKEDETSLSDLKCCLRKAKITNFKERFSVNDVIAFANCEVTDNKIIITNASLILCIGRVDQAYITKCLRHEEKHRKCSIYIDIRNNTTCNFHCKEQFLEAGQRRMILKQTTEKYAFMLPESTKRKRATENLVVNADNDNDIAELYIKKNKYTRSARLMKALQIDKIASIGRGYKPGDIIKLED